MSRPENTTGLNRTQHPDPDGRVPESPLLAIVPEDEQRTVIALLIAERAHATTWWTILNEMRCRKLLPDWALKMDAGSHPSYDKWDADCRASNLAMLACKGHLNALIYPSEEFAPQNVQFEIVARDSEAHS